MSATENVTERDEVDRRVELLFMRRQLRDALNDPDTPAAAKAALSRELRAVVNELDAVKPEEGSAVDDLAKRRADRRAGADVPASAARRSQPRRRGGSTGTA